VAGKDELKVRIGLPWFSRLAGRLFSDVAWHTEVIGRENVPVTGGVLLAANHSSVLDGPVVVGVAPRGVQFLIKEEMYKGPLGTFLRRSNQISVDRDGGRQALAIARKVLLGGGCVGVFPEGNRGRGDAAAARAGVAWLALATGATVVPVAVLGTRRTGESVGHLPRLRRRLVVEFGAPITVTRAEGVRSKVALEEANEVLRDALASLVAGAAARTGIELPTDAPPRRDAG